MVAVGVAADGRREVLGFDVGGSENEGFWAAFLRSLKTRGLVGVKLAISDAHNGLKKAISTVFQGAGWQRCRVHFMRNVLAFTGFPARHWRQIWSTNPMERVNKEIKRRTDVVRVFPNPAALLRLAGAVLVEQHDEWEAGDRRYLLRNLHGRTQGHEHHTHCPRSGSDFAPRTHCNIIKKLTRTVSRQTPPLSGT